MLSNLMFLSQSIPPGEQPWAERCNPDRIVCFKRRWFVERRRGGVGEEDP